MKATVAYFSMEIGIKSSIPTYSGGLGVLAGDTIRSAADLGINMVAVTLLQRYGYFQQNIDGTGWQTEEPDLWSVEDMLEEIPVSVSVYIEGREVHLRVWRYNVKGIKGDEVPVYFLDTDFNSNSEADKTITHYLYGGDNYYRLCQEVVLGIGGVKMLRALGYSQIDRFHMNEGHPSLLVLELLSEIASKINGNTINHKVLEAVRSMCVYTTHTPVPAGHDQFPLDMANKVLQAYPIFKQLEDSACCDKVLNMTYLALNNSYYINGVAKKHKEVSQRMYQNYVIHAITNGVHLATWASDSWKTLYDKFVPGWREDNTSLRCAISLPKNEIWNAHLEAKSKLIHYINEVSKIKFDEDTFTIGFARRATLYKRHDLLFYNVDRLNEIAEKTGPMQLVFGGKAHPHDQSGKEIIQKIYRVKNSLHPNIKFVYLSDYNIILAKLLISGVDVWLNTPLAPLEASGTSGMKAAVNGVPSFSILDGWWIEGCIENVTGWSIGNAETSSSITDINQIDANHLYNKLENTILPLYYQNRDAFIEVMRHAIGVNASHFNTERMLNQYVTKAYFR